MTNPTQPTPLNPPQIQHGMQIRNELMMPVISGHVKSLETKSRQN